MKKVSIIGSVGVPAKYGGFETLVQYLTKLLSNKNLIYMFFVVQRNIKKNVKYYNNSNLYIYKSSCNGIQSILYDIISILNL
jgi:uncharacterized protein with WD repeat